ncbi:hypothetical protein GCM10022631_11270 [Deinococcus rubellus]|uniref:hypothetical protein n=1 Tax=Deinococcus rubellus TaxID=1889240 RepID=UPI0031E51665
MRNLKFKSDNGRGVSLALTVPVGTVAGQLVPIGAAGLYGYAETDAVTPALRTLGRAPQGLRDGQATVNLPGIGQVIDLGILPGGTNDGDKLYQTPGGAVTATATSNLFIGWKLGAYVGLRDNA